MDAGIAELVKELHEEGSRHIGRSAHSFKYPTVQLLMMAAASCIESLSTPREPVAYLRYKHGGAGSWLVMCEKHDAEAFPVYAAPQIPPTPDREK